MNKPNDSETLRDALVAIVDYYQTTCRSCSHIVGVLHTLVENARAALAKPRRNCDVGAAEEQYRRFMAMCNSKDGRQCSTCEFRLNCYTGRDECFARWAQMPYDPAYDMGD